MENKEFNVGTVVKTKDGYYGVIMPDSYREGGKYIVYFSNGKRNIVEFDDLENIVVVKAWIISNKYILSLGSRNIDEFEVTDKDGDIVWGSNIRPKCIYSNEHTITIDGKKIKEDTWYELEGNRFVTVKNV